MSEEISNTSLKLPDIPEPGASWYEIAGFALTFDGYGHWGSFDRCAEIGNNGAENYGKDQTLPRSLTELRTCLFFEQRRWHHFGDEPDGRVMVYIRALVEAIRANVSTGIIDRGNADVAGDPNAS
jgi:hypothetical protein